MPTEMRVLAMRDAAARDRAITHTPEFVRFGVEHAEVSREVAQRHGAYDGAGRYNKQLLHEAEKLETLRSLAGQIHQYFYKITLPGPMRGIDYCGALLLRAHHEDEGVRAGLRAAGGGVPGCVDPLLSG